MIKASKPLIESWSQTPSVIKAPASIECARTILTTLYHFIDITATGGSGQVLKQLKNCNNNRQDSPYNLFSSKGLP